MESSWRENGAAVDEGKQLREGAGAEFVEGPGVFVRELVDDVALLHGARENFPGVGFHFDVAAESGILGEEIDDAEDLVAGGVEEFGGAALEWDVEMDSPFGELGVGESVECGSFGEGDVEVFGAGDAAVGPAGDDLMDVNGLDEIGERGAGGASGADFERRAEMEFADLNAVGAEAADGIGGGFVFDGEMAGVVIDAEMAGKAIVVGTIRAQLMEEIHRFGGGFQVT